MCSIDFYSKNKSPVGHARRWRQRLVFVDRSGTQFSVAVWVRPNLNSEIKQDCCENLNEQVPEHFMTSWFKNIFTEELCT